MIRKCVKCDKEKSIEEFSLADIKREYRRHECKACESERKIKWYNANHAREVAKRKKYQWEHRGIRPVEVRKRNAEYQKRYRLKLKTKVFNHYGNECACCGETEPCFLSIDHVNNDGYAMRKYGGHVPQHHGARFYLWIVNHNFPDDFQILCMNCNFGKARNGGICPHQTGSTTISKESRAKRPEAHRALKGDDIVSSAVKAVAVH